jgi:hypothetical protein
VIQQNDLVVLLFLLHIRLLLRPAPASLLGLARSPV